MSEPLEKPPLGLTPRSIWEANRLFAIKQAMNRYLDSGKEVPVEWLEEFLELFEKLYWNEYPEESK